MTETPKRILTKFKDNIEELNFQRRMWLILSSVIFFGVLTVVIWWSPLVNLQSQTLWWGIGSTGLVVTINWWYWTIMLVRQILNHQKDIVLILSEITNEVRDIRSDITELNHRNEELRS